MIIPATGRDSPARDGTIQYMSSNAPASGTSSPELEIVSIRRVEVPQAKVWRAWTQPEHLGRWWGPNGFRNRFETFDLRPGGDWRFVMQGPGGALFPNHSRFVEVQEPERLVFDHLSSPRFRVVATFAAEEGGTRVVFRMVFGTAAECARIRPVAVDANEQNFDRLEAVLASMG